MSILNLVSSLLTSKKRTEPQSCVFEPLEPRTVLSASTGMEGTANVTHNPTTIRAVPPMSTSPNSGWKVAMAQTTHSQGTGVPANPGLGDGDGSAFRDRMNVRISAEEGRESHAYRDTNEIWTIGIGHNMNTDDGQIQDVTGNPKEDYIPQADTNNDQKIDGKDAVKRTLTDAQIDKLFEKDYKSKLDQALKDVPNLGQLVPTVQEAVVDFVYNLGSMDGFPSLKAALAQTKYREAAWQMSHKDGS